MTTKKIGRGRPRGFDVEGAIAIATDLFHRRGYDGVGIAELSKAIGISAPSLYSAFGNKRSLFEQVLQRYVQSSSGWLMDALSIEAELEVVINQLFVSAAETYSRDSERPGCLALDGARNCCSEAQVLTAKCRQNIRRLIRDRITAGELAISEEEADILSDYAMMVLLGLSASARDGITPQSLKVIAKVAAIGFVQRLQQYQNNTS